MLQFHGKSRPASGIGSAGNQDRSGPSGHQDKKT
jgi:hypothetical protein